ncbi:MAG: hypothetical protein GY810_29885 [Aureispira sp.]|nr:hypothetical protein [Aureispira sp.]
MKTLQKIGTGLFCFIFLILSYQETKATHVLGGTIRYECVGPNQYEVTTTLYRDCNGINFPGSRTISWTGSLGSGSSTATIVPGSRKDITPFSPSACNGGTGALGAEEQSYSTIITILSGCTDVTFSSSVCCHGGLVSVSGSPPAYVECKIVGPVSFCNNAPYFTNPPLIFTCINNTFSYNPGAIDPDGDSLVYSLVDAMSSSGKLVNYMPSFSGTQPLGASSPITIDPLTGAIIGSPTLVGGSVLLTVFVEEYRNGILIGSVLRSTELMILTCNNNQAPTMSGINGGTAASDYSLTTCFNSSVAFDLIGIDLDNDDIQMNWNQGISSASFTTGTGFSSSPDTAHFSWQPTSSHLGNNYFTVMVSDTVTPISGYNMFTYNINVT